MSESKSIILNGQVLHGSDRLGRWKVTQLEGWNDSPPPRNQDISRSNSDGDFNLPSYLGARLVTIGGRVICPSPAAAQHLRSRLTGLVPAGTIVRAQVMDEGVLQWADVKLSDVVKTKRVGCLVRFQYQLRSPNPRKYGDLKTFTFTSVGELYQWGNHPASPVFTVTGNAPGGYTINGAYGEEYKVTKPLAPGSPHTINFADATLRINGVLTSNGNGAADVWGTAAGSVTQYTFTSAGSVSVSAAVLDTYI